MTKRSHYQHVKSKRRRDLSRSRERGSVLEEFVMVAPVMLLIAGSALRFYQELQAQEVGITYAREVATLAYNQCVDITRFAVQQVGSTTQDTVTVDVAGTKKDITACLKRVVSKFNTGWEKAKPVAGSSSITITVAVVRCNINQVMPTDCNQPTPLQEGSGQLPKYTLSQFRNRLVVARISFDTIPIATFIPSISSRNVTYDATV